MSLQLSKLAEMIEMKKEDVLYALDAIQDPIVITRADLFRWRRCQLYDGPVER